MIKITSLEGDLNYINPDFVISVSSHYHEGSFCGDRCKAVSELQLLYGGQAEIVGSLDPVDEIVSRIRLGDRRL